MPVLESPTTAAAPLSPVMPTLLGEGYGTYRARPLAFVLSFSLNTVIGILLVLSGHWVVAHRTDIQNRVITLVSDVSPYVLPPSKTEAGGGGGGGDRDKLAASKGSPPKFAREQITPPMVVVRNLNPQLTAPPTVVGPPDLKLPQLG